MQTLLASCGESVEGRGHVQRDIAHAYLGSCVSGTEFSPQPLVAGGGGDSFAGWPPTPRRDRDRDRRRGRSLGGCAHHLLLPVWGRLFAAASCPQTFALRHKPGPTADCA